MCVGSSRNFMLHTQGWGLLKLCLLISLLQPILILVKCKLDPLNHIYIWQVSLQLSCSDACQIWRWYSVGNWCIDNSEKWEKWWKRRNGFVTPTPYQPVTSMARQYNWFKWSPPIITNSCLINIGSDKALVPSGNKPLPEPVLTQIYVTTCCH